MEVHTHTHHGKKKWTEYLWEFLMLFLAVFCGFLAENGREHLVENQREKEYMHSLVEDLQTDTLKLNREILFGQEISGRIEKLVSFLNNDYMPKDSIEKLYLLNQQAGRVVKVDFEDRTSSQLKNSGTMRLVRNKQVTDSIRNYWSIIKVAEDISDRLEMLRGKARDVGVQLFYDKYVKFSDVQNPLISKFSVSPGASLINDDPKLLAEYANWRNSTLFVLNNYIVYMKEAGAAAQNLINLVRKKYHFQ
ncbi:MAG: hypothetical protein JST10_04860 [Bacteroidetes bacterium]|nr:hypothetical protein [Bacteroidota bacterium]MBS1631884.1 hypothetical protein [Bacteroidota bacterium]